MANRAAFVESEKGAIVVRDAEISKPGEGEVLIKDYFDRAECQIGDVEYDKAVTLGSYTPLGTLFGKRFLNRRPTVPVSPLPASEQGKKILIWGGSSATGSLVISYAKQAGYTVISTSSKHNFGLLKSLGADHVFDHSDPVTVDAISNFSPIDYWLDTISLKPTVSTILKILAPEGQPVTKSNIVMLLPPAWLGIEALPEGVTTQFYQISTDALENAERRKHFLGRVGFMEQAIKKAVSSKEFHQRC